MPQTCLLDRRGESCHGEGRAFEGLTGGLRIDTSLRCQVTPTRMAATQKEKHERGPGRGGAPVRPCWGRERVSSRAERWGGSSGGWTRGYHVTHLPVLCLHLRAAAPSTGEGRWEHPSVRGRVVREKTALRGSEL